MLAWVIVALDRSGRRGSGMPESLRRQAPIEGDGAPVGPDPRACDAGSWVRDRNRGGPRTGQVDHDGRAGD